MAERPSVGLPQYTAELDAEGERQPGTAFAPNAYPRMAESEPVGRDGA